MLSIDPRVGSSKNYTRAEKVEFWLEGLQRHGVPAEIRQLEFGDFAWQGFWLDDRPVRVGLEHKTVNDLVGSIHSGRLSGHQIPGMVQSYEFRYLMVEGVYRPALDGMVEVANGRGFGPTTPPVTFREITNYLNSAEQLAGLSLRRVFGPTESIATIASLYSWWQKPWAQHKSMEYLSHVKQEVPYVFRRPNQVEMVAMTLPDIGPKKARSLAKRYRTVVDFVHATEEELLKVPGIGERLAKLIVKSLREVRK